MFHQLHTAIRHPELVGKLVIISAASGPTCTVFAPVALSWIPPPPGSRTSGRALPLAGSRRGYLLLALPAIVSVIALPLLLLVGALQTVGVIRVPAD